MRSTTKLTWQNFFILLVGFLILFTAVFFIVTAYWRLNRSHLTSERISNEIVRIVNLAKNIKPALIRESLNYIHSPGIRVSVTQGQSQQIMLVYNVNIKDIKRQVLKKPDDVKLTFPLGNDYFLHIKTHITHPLTLKIQFYAAFLVWLAALIGFCYYIVHRFSLPLSNFIEGANRFSQDINAPALPEIGHKSSRNAFQAFNRMQANLKQLIQSRTQMLAAISHDLRTPITRLKLRLENLAESKTTKKMQSDLDRMENMIQSILHFAQDEYQHEQVSNIDLNALCESICDDFQDINMPVQFKELDEKFICLGRMQALRRAISNLISNGIKYGDRVTVELAKQQHFVKIIINDQGLGIPDAELEQVFLPFYRLDEARQEDTGGSGLGLATARDIIRSHGGDIELRNLAQGGLSAIIKITSMPTM